MTIKYGLAKMGLLSLAVLLLGGADQWLKQVLEVGAKTGKQWGPITFLWHENPGIAFSINLPAPVAVGLVIILLIILIRLFWLSQGRSWAYLLGLILVISGGLSNLIDKLRFGFVRDFIAISWLPIFNFADVMILTGLIIVVVNIGYDRYKQKI